ncbi:MAG TPA: aspartate carbamoyltransferase [Bacteroidales bacterium]|jgi:aspartate carbamoyltransferase catalytic subunit|nr:aspartate carbamoyltransferase [Bacteroidales bacterium]HQB22825.1 aspartate carbamoyltransferase [Bacteroidales bacterium]
MKSLISINDFDKDEMLQVLDLAAEYESNPNCPIFKDKLIACIFFEPSTRTRLSFETAATRLGARFVGFASLSHTSIAKGESLKDTIKMVSNYADMIVIRHHLDGAARYASEIADCPVINAGDGANQHPTQTLLDMYSIRKTQGTLENLSITVVGDLKYGRTVHSLLQAMSHFNPRFNFVSCPDLEIPQEYKNFLDSRNIPYTQHHQLEGQIQDADILYVTRVQQERFQDPMEYERVKNLMRLDASMLTNTRPNLRILHPLPRVNEIAIDVDDRPEAYYFEQARNGVFTRMGIITHLMNQ